MYQSYTRFNATGLPETYVFVAGYDILRDEGLLFAKRLNQVRHYKDWWSLCITCCFDQSCIYM